MPKPPQIQYQAQEDTFRTISMQDWEIRLGIGAEATYTLAYKGILIAPSLKAIRQLEQGLEKYFERKGRVCQRCQIELYCVMRNRQLLIPEYQAFDLLCLLTNLDQHRHAMRKISFN